MRLIRSFLVLVISLSTVMALGQSDDIKKQLSSWGARHKSDSGTLLNPPIGSKSAQVKAIEDLVREILFDLYPGLAKEYQFTVGVYPSADINAFVENVDRNKFGDVLQNFYKLDIKKPIYHVGVTIGLFNKLATSAEVAFVLGHELSHLLEGHVDAESPETKKDQGKTWWSGQRFEAIADHNGIKLMVGKYDLQAAIDALWKLAENHREEDQTSEIAKVANSFGELMSTHHDPSVRLSMAQSYVEYLRKTNPAAQPRPVFKLSKKLGRLRNGRTFENWQGRIPDWSDVDLAYVTELHDELVNKVISNTLDESANLELDLFTFARAWLGKEEIEKPSLGFTLMSVDSLRKMTSGRIQNILKNPSWTPEQKVTALLSSYLALKQFDPGAMTQPTSAQDTYARALIPLLKDENVNLVRVVKTMRLLPETVSKFPLFSLLVGTKEGKRLYHLAVRSQLFIRDNGESRHDHFWLDDSDSKSVSMKAFRLGNQLNNLLAPFMDSYAQDKAARENSMFPRMADQAYRKTSARVVNEELARVAEYFDSISFNKEVAEDSDLLFQFNSLLEEIKRSLFPVEFRDNLFFTKAKEREKSVFDAWSKKRTAFFQKIKNTDNAFTAETINELISYFDLESSFPFSKDDLAVLAQNWNKLVDSDLEHHVFNRRAGRMIEAIVASGLLPVSNDKATNLKSLVYIASNTGSEQALDMARVAQVFQSVSLDEMKKVLMTHYFKQADTRFADEMKSETYAKSLEKVRESKSLKDQTLGDFFRMSGPSLFETIYFSETPNRLSEEEQKRHFGLLELLSTESLSKVFVSQFSLEDVQRIIRNIHLLNSKERTRKAKFTPADIREKLESGFSDMGKKAEGLAGRFGHGEFRNRLPFLFDVFAARQAEISSLDVWVKTLRSLLNISEAALDLRPDLKVLFENKFLLLSNQGQDPRAYLFVRNSSLEKTLTENSLVLVMLSEIKRRLGTKTSIEDLKAAFDSVNEDQKLQERQPDVFSSLQKKVAEEFKLQPDNINKIFPQNEQDLNTKNTAGLSSEIRGLSALTALARTRNSEEQLQLIDYLMGRSGNMPSFVLKWEEDLHQSVQPLVYGARVKLEHESELMRAFLVNSLLTGPQGLMNQPGIEAFLIERLFGDSPNKEMIQEISTALLKSLGRNKSMALAYVLAQRANGTGKIDEGTALRSLLEAFGVAGIKLGQYLAFTSELEAFRESLAALQDSALPVSYLEILYLVRKRLGEDWSKRWKIVKLIGSGSVNIAIEVQSNTGEKRVISILRDEIETASREDFRNLTNFVEELVKSKTGEKYSFLPGLLKIIEASVALEFNKENSAQRQKDAGVIYNRKVEGWRLRAPRVYEVENGSLMMQEASGKTARKIRQQNFELYKKVMGIVLDVELEHLINGQFIRSRPFPAFSNPDVHDGQVIIDAEKKTITILDFGQAVSIPKAERDLGLDFIRMIAGHDSKESLKKQLEEMRVHLQGQEKLTPKELTDIYAKKEAMDRFVFILGIVQKKNWNVPLSSVHYVLGMNRVFKLGDILGKDMTKRLEVILKTRAVTNSTELGYYISKLFDEVRTVVKMCKSIVAE